MTQPNDPFALGMPRTPTYAPGQSPAMMQDPMGLIVAMFGIPMLQKMAGPNSFLPQLTPGQQLADQFTASQYQRASIGASLAASQAGDEDVNARVLGLMSMLTGQHPSQLNDAQTRQLASVANHPVTKMVLGQMIGTDNLEAIYFGQKGDPAALASAVNRTGFFRRDSLGGERMTAESLQGFSKALHANLYGEGANLDDMHGLMAGQTGQLYEQLFQRGMLPQALGALSPAERVKAISETSRDAPTMNRLADEYNAQEMRQSGRKFTLNKDYKYDELSLQQQDAVLEAELPGYRTKKFKVDGKEVTFDQLTPERQDKELEAALPGYNTKTYTTSRTGKEFSFAELTEQQQKELLEKNRGAGLAAVQGTLRNVDAFRAEDPRSKSPQQIEIESAVLEKLPGGATMLRNADAAKVAGKLKEFTGAVAAVREIFGDNGNANAPFPALLAALDHLSQGSISQIGAGKVETTLRSMRVAARDAGIGFEQLAGMSAEVGAYGDTLGIARPIAMQNTLNAVVMAKSMRDTGQFEKPLFGRMDQAEATREVAMRMTRGDASGVGMTLAAMSRAVATNPEQFAPEMQEMAKAYKEGKETFTVGNKTYNLAEMAGMGGAAGLANFYTKHGGNVDTLRALARDPGTQEYLKAGYAYKTQRYQLQRDLGNEIVRGRFADRMTSADARTALEAAGVQENEQEGFASQLGNIVTKRMLEETGGMTSEQRVEHLQKNIVNDIAGTLTGPDAQKRAAALANILVGSDNKSRTDFFLGTIADANTFSVSRTGRHLAGNAQIYDKAVIEKSARDGVLIENRARRMADMSRGNESSIVQRMSEGVAEIGRGGEFDLKSFTQRTAGILKVAGMKDKFAPDFADALGAGTEALGKAEAAGNEEEAQRLAAVIHAIHNGNEKDLITVAARGFADKRIQEQKLEGKAAAEVRAQYEKAALGDTAALEAVKTQMDTSTFKLFKGLYTARTVHDKEGGLTLSGSGFAPLVKEAAQHFDNAEKADREAQARALYEAGKQRVDAERTKQNTDAKNSDDAKQKPGILSNALDAIWGAVGNVFGGEVDKGTKPAPKQDAAPAGNETTSVSATTVQLTADSVSVAQRASAASTTGVQLRPEDFPTAAAPSRPSTNALAQTSQSGGKEMALTGTITLKNLQEGIVSFVGEPALSTGDGPPIMHPHTLPG